MKGWRVLVTRPEAGPLKERLRERGAIPVVVPTIEIVELGPGGRLDDAAREIEAFGWIVVTSVHGARALFRRLRALSIAPPASPRWAAVGPATAAALEAEGVRVERVPAAGTGVALAGLLGDLTGVRVLLPRARIAGADLPAALRARGARVDDVAAYETVIGPERSRAPLATALDEGLEAAVFTSGSTVEGFFRLAAAPRRALAEIPAVCIGISTARALADAGFEPAAVAEEPSPRAIVEALERTAHARA